MTIFYIPNPTQYLNLSLLGKSCSYTLKNAGLKTALGNMRTNPATGLFSTNNWVKAQKVGLNI